MIETVKGSTVDSVCLSVCSSTLGQVYSEHRDEDGFLYVAYSGENTFGRDCCGDDDV